jgi:phosphonate transport system substrate-binding protein
MASVVQRTKINPVRRAAPGGSRRRGTNQRLLRFASFLAPNLFPVYQFIVQQLAAKLRCTIELFTGTSYQQLATEVDAAFVCGLAYVQLCRDAGFALEPLVAPILHGDRYGDQPIYFSDVIVRRERGFRSFADLRGCSWSYNERYSHSGYGITRYELARRGEINGFFGRVVKAGYHERSIRLVCSGAVDASAIDSQVLTLTLRGHPALAAQLRVLETFGPSTIQPLVVARRLPERVRADLLSVLVDLGADPAAQTMLARGLIKRLIPIDDSAYDDIRHMLATAEAAGLPAIR